MNRRKEYLFVGSYASENGFGINVYQFDSLIAELNWCSICKEVKNPSFLRLSSDKKKLYAVEETDGKENSKVLSFTFNEKEGELSLLNEQLSHGAAPCHLEIIPNDSALLASNYVGGNLSLFPLSSNGSIEKASQIIAYNGSSIDPDRQLTSHVHSSVLSPDHKYLFVCNLGTDIIYRYEVDLKKSEIYLDEDSEKQFKVKPGSGPRHLVFSKSSKYAFLSMELTGEVCFYSYENGELILLQTEKLCDEDFQGKNSAAEVKLSFDDRFLYVSNRGDANEITIFEIDQLSGKLMFVQRKSTKGESPRHFIIDPSGKFLLVCNQNSGNLVVFNRDTQSGKLHYLKEITGLTSPVYLLFS